ncbi:TPA: tape measure protein [Raoultella ornithinolytica]|nr:tape measure protein [Raoultella ornithinolytica]
MAEKAGEIYYDIEADVSGLIQAQQQVNKRLDQMESKFEQSSRSAGRFEGALNKVGVAIAAAFTIDAAKKLIAIGDEMVTLQARVARLSPSIDVAKETLSALSAIASQTGNSLSETERLWESLTTALKETGATNSQILGLTSTLQKIGTIGGSSTEEMANALRQFGQSISGGIVRAEEFNSILEQMPELARQIAAGLGISIGELRKRMLEGKLTAQDALNAIQKQSQSVNEEFEKMPVSIDRAKNSLDVAFKNAINDLNQAIGLTSTLAGLMQSVADNLNYYNNNVGDSSRMPKLIKLQQDLNSELKDSQRWYESDSVFQARRAQAAVQLKQVEGEIAHIRAKAQKDAGNNQFNAPATKGDDAATKKLVQNSERRLALAKLEGEARARLQAQYDAADAGVTDQKRIKALQDEYAETYRVTEARKESNKVGKQSETQSESIAQKLANLKQQSELAADSTQELSREQAILTAQLSLGKGATQEQVALAGQYAATKWDTANAIRAQAAAEKLLPEARENASYTQDVKDLQTALDAKKITQQQYDQTSEQLEAQHQANLAKIRSQQAVTPQQQAAGDVDPVQNLANQHAQQLALIQQYEQQGVIVHNQALLLKNAADMQYEKARADAQWALFTQQSVGYEALGAAVDAFGAQASNALTGIITGSMSASDALQSIGNTILNDVINTFVQMGLQQAKSAIMGASVQQATIAATTATQVGALATTTAASTASAGTTMAAWLPAALVASVGSFGAAAIIGGAALVGAFALSKTLSSGRKNGGPVSAGSVYPVGEGNLPEFMQTSKGLFMIPGDDGRVFSNKDVTSGSPSIKKASTGSEYLSQASGSSGSSGSQTSKSISVNVQFYDQTSGGQHSFEAQAMQQGNVLTVDAFLRDLDSAGPMASGMESTYGLRRQASGAY